MGVEVYFFQSINYIYRHTHTYTYAESAWNLNIIQGIWFVVEYVCTIIIEDGKTYHFVVGNDMRENKVEIDKLDYTN